MVLRENSGQDHGWTVILASHVSQTPRLLGGIVRERRSGNWWYDVGLGQDLAHGVVNLSVFLEEYRALVPSVENARELLAAVSLRSAGGWRVQFTASAGMSNGAPDHGFAFGASRRF